MTECRPRTAPGGVAQSAASRSTTSSILLSLAALALEVTPIGCYRRRSAPWAVRARRHRLALILVIVATLAKSYEAGLQGLFAQHRREAQGRACLLRVTSPLDPCLTLLYPVPQQVWGNLRYLRSARLAGLRPVPTVSTLGEARP